MREILCFAVSQGKELEECGKKTLKGKDTV